MSAAILHVLRRHSFRDGRNPLGFQSCDHSTAQRDLYDEPTCAANTKAYVAHTDVIGVVGPFNSGCAYAQIPIASRAGLAMVSPTNSDVGLTRVAFGAPRDALRALYPAGRRTFVHVKPPDDAQAAADAVLARQLGARRVLVVHDGEYGVGFAAYFRNAAGRLGLRVVDTVRWNPDRLRLRRVAARARRSNPQAVFLCGLINTSAGEVLAVVRRALPPSVPVIACNCSCRPHCCSSEPVRRREGRTSASRGSRTNDSRVPGKRSSANSAPHNPMGGSTWMPCTRRKRPSFCSTRSLAPTARAPPSSQNSSKRAFGARLLGSFAIDSDGDPTPAPIAIVRPERGGGADVVESYEGARVDRVIRPPRRLPGKSG